MFGKARIRLTIFNTTAEVLKWPRVWLLDVWILLVACTSVVCGRAISFEKVQGAPGSSKLH
jgi:hypothetical protein